MRIGVISDTHGLLRPEAVDALRGVDQIVHAGDIGKPDVIDGLEQLAPVTAIRGNIDQDDWARGFPETREVELGGRRIWLLHNLKELDFDPAAEGFDIVVAGHSHQPLTETRDGVLYLNPGSAGPRRFSLPVAVATLTVDRAGVHPRIIELEVTSRKRK